MPTLVLKDPSFDGQSCRLPDGEYSVGSHSGNSIQIMEPSVSDQHCRLLVFGNEVIVRESGSRLGVFVEGRRVVSQMGIKHCQTLTVGRVETMVLLDLDQNPHEASMTALDDLRRDLHASRDEAMHCDTFPVVFRPTDSTEREGSP